MHFQLIANVNSMKAKRSVDRFTSPNWEMKRTTVSSIVVMVFIISSK